MSSESPFYELDEIEQRACLDLAVAVAIIETRATLSPDLIKELVEQFASKRALPLNSVRYSLKHVGTSLFRQDWEFSCSKHGAAITTEFRPLSGNGST